MSFTLLSAHKSLNLYFMVFILFFISYGYFFQGGGWNQNARICLTRAILHDHSFTIDSCKEDSEEMEFVNTGDWSFYQGHYYCNKSPGLSFMAVPPFALAELCLQYLLPDDPERQILFSAYFSTLFTTVLMSSLLCLLIFHLCHRFFLLDIRSAFLLAFLYGFGTLAFSYSTTFYCHQPAAFCSFFSFVLALLIRHGHYQKKRGMAVLAGFSAGLAVLFEPSTLLVLVMVLVYMMCFKESRGYFLLFVLGCVVPGILQGTYNFVCFGHPLASSYGYANDMVMWKLEGKLFGIPSPKIFYYLLFSPHRGLFLSSPIFLMALFGVFFLLKDKKWRAEAIFCTILSLCFIIFIASFHARHGGSAVGPRYLLPVFPFIFFLIIFSLNKYPRAFKVLGFLSVLINLSITLIGNEIPLRIKNPLGDVILKNMLEGNVSINPVPFSHFYNYSIEALADMERWTPNFNSFNLGEIIFPHSLASVVPLIGFWIIWWVLFWRRFLRRTQVEKVEVGGAL
jgi:hypothetical protein